MKQTAVDYIKEKLMCNEYWYENMTFDQIIEQAKAMEKEQIMKAFYKGRQEEQYKNLFNNHVRKSEEQYYKETYESKTNI